MLTEVPCRGDFCGTSLPLDIERLAISANAFGGLGAPAAPPPPPPPPKPINWLRCSSLKLACAYGSETRRAPRRRAIKVDAGPGAGAGGSPGTAGGCELGVSVDDETGENTGDVECAARP